MESMACAPGRAKKTGGSATEQEAFRRKYEIASTCFAEADTGIGTGRFRVICGRLTLAARIRMPRCRRHRRSWRRCGTSEGRAIQAVVQCKRYGCGNKVSSSEIREFAGSSSWRVQKRVLLHFWRVYTLCDNRLLIDFRTCNYSRATI